MSRIDEIRRQLELPSRAQCAWETLTSKEKKIFILLANLEPSQIINKAFDKLASIEQSKISRAILLASNIAAKFSAHIKPEAVREFKELRAA